MPQISDIVQPSIEWTAAILFRPFKLKKWLILTFIAVMAGYVTGGGNLRAMLPEQEETSVNAPDTETAYAPGTAVQHSAQPQSPREELRAARDTFLTPQAVRIVIIIVTASIMVLLALLWLSARFSFIFLRAITSNSLSITGPFRAFRLQGNSYFSLAVITSVVYLFLFGATAWLWLRTFIDLGAFDTPRTIGILALIFKSIPFILVFTGLTVSAAIIHLVFEDFMLIVMTARNATVMPALTETIALIARNKLATLKYFCIKTALGICAGFIAFIVNFVTLLTLLVPIIMIVAAFYALHRSIPPAFQAIARGGLFLLAIPIIGAFWYFFACLQLPFAVFFRTFSVKFMGKLDNRYNLFNLNKL